MLHEIAPHEFHLEYTPRPAKETDYVILFSRNTFLAYTDEKNSLTVPVVSQCPDSILEHLIFLCAVDDFAFYTTLDDSYAKPFGIYDFKRPHDLRKSQPQWLSFATLTAFRIAMFYDKNRFCGHCGSPLTPLVKERGFSCPHCNSLVFPSIPPSVIVLIRNGEKCLLTRYQASHNPFRGYALVAGYIETGETPEHAIERETFEEVGLHVKNISYIASQPWPISGSLLLGYVCDLDGDDKITLETGELEEAVWFDRKDIEPRETDVSLTSYLIERFRKGTL